MSLATLLALYAAGIATFASPCVLPLLPLYLSLLGGASLGASDPARARSRLRRAGIGFAIGLSAVFVVLGMGASASARLLVAHHAALSVGAGVLMVLFGAKLLGLLRWRVLDREARPLLERIPSPGGLAGGVLFGAAFAVGWTPCVGPVLGAALTYAASHAASPAVAGVELFAYAAGLSTPLVAAAFAAPKVLAAAKKLSGVTPVVQRVTGALLVATGVLLALGKLDVLAPNATAGTMARLDEHCDTQAGCAAPSAVSPPGVEAELPSGAPHLVEFMSGHCRVCAKLAPVVAQLEQKCAKDGSIVRVNVDTPEGNVLATRYGVRVVPTFVEVDAHGREVERIVGETSGDRIAVALGDVRGVACSSL